MLSTVNTWVRRNPNTGNVLRYGAAHMHVWLLRMVIVHGLPCLLVVCYCFRL